MGSNPGRAPINLSLCKKYENIVRKRGNILVSGDQLVFFVYLCHIRCKVIAIFVPWYMAHDTMLHRHTLCVYVYLYVIKRLYLKQTGFYIRHSHFLYLSKYDLRGLLRQSEINVGKFGERRNKFGKTYREKNSAPKFTGQGRAVKPRYIELCLDWEHITHPFIVGTSGCMLWLQ